jgi:ATP-binding cassette subfamily F protein uup
MDKIVDHLFILEKWRLKEDFPGNYSDFRAYEDSTMLHRKKKTKQRRKTGSKTTGNLTFNEQKNIKK